MVVSLGVGVFLITVDLAYEVLKAFDALIAEFSLGGLVKCHFYFHVCSK